MLHYIRHCACLIAKTGMTVALGLMVMTASFADTLPAGNFVTNRAETRFFNPRLGITERIFSNTVEALVIEAPAIEVTGFSDLLLARGAQEQHYFSVQNTGNSPLNIMLDVQNHAEAGLLTAQEIYVDVNNNGLIDSQDQLVQPQITLAIDAKISLIYQFVVAPNAPVGATATSTLVVMANSVNTGAPLNDVPSALGHVTIVEQGLELSKSVQQRTMGTGQNLTFTLQLRNNGQVDVAGYDAVDGTSILIDGHPAIGVLVFDEIPLNTQFSAVQATGGLQPLYHLQGAPKHSYQTRAPDQNGQVDAVGFFWAGAYPVGQSSDLSFSVNLINDLGPMSVRNIAYTYAGGETFASNEVVFDRATGIAQISFIDGAGNETQFAALGADAAVQIFSGACNTTFQIDRFDVTITSQITGDSEVVRAHETAANSGVFITTNLPLVQMPNPVAFDGVLASDQGDTLSARADCDTIALVTTAMVNPGSFVFNSVTNAPVSDATVYVVDAAGVRHATVQSDHTGYFVVGDLPAGQYRYEVSTPSGFAFPSVRQSFPGYERATGSFSYGRMFSHDGGSLHHKDIPLDPAYGVPLTLEKTVDRQVVSTGQMATYTLTVLNQMDQALIAAEVIDVIPSGTQLVPGSVIMNGEKASDPVIAANNDHVFDLGDMMPLAQIELRYTLRFTPAATQGDAVNIAVVSGLQAGTGQVRVSNTARAVVRINNSGGVFTRQGTIIGSVFLDCNENGLRDGADELGVPGVQITTQEGLSVVTDLHGKYSFIAMRPVSHVLSLMERTLPANTSVRVSKTADLGRGGSRLVAVTRGGLHSEEFGLSACSADVIAAMNDRRAAFAGRALTSGQLRSDLPFNSGQADRRSSRSQAGLATTTQIQSNDPEQMLLQRTNTAAVERRTLESQVKMFDTTLAFLNLADGQQVSNAAISVDVKGPGDLTLNLQLNGRDVSATHIGETTLWAEGNVQARRFVAVDLRAGKNTLSLTGTDPFGIVRALQTVVITAPGAPHHIQVTAPATAIAAAGQPVPVTVTFMDAQGVPVNVSSGV
ncbi:MAG: carboxypeptidase regulatory-like domain-containing protein, partial [Planktomarina sp.]